MSQIIRVEGLAELRETLTSTLPKRLQGQAMQAALAKGAALIVRQAKVLAPRKSGVLRRAIYQARSRASTRDRPSRIIRVRQGRKQQEKNRDAYYWRWVEFGRGQVTAGQRTGRIVTGKKIYKTCSKVLGTPATGFFGKSVRAAPARPFMRPAFEAQKYAALEAIRAAIGEEIKDVAARAAARAASRAKK